MQRSSHWFLRISSRIVVQILKFLMIPLEVTPAILSIISSAQHIFLGNFARKSLNKLPRIFSKNYQWQFLRHYWRNPWKNPESIAIRNLIVIPNETSKELLRGSLKNSILLRSIGGMSRLICKIMIETKIVGIIAGVKSQMICWSIHLRCKEIHSRFFWKIYVSNSCWRKF